MNILRFKYVNTILLLALLSFVLVFHFNLHRNAHIAYNPARTVDWYQPSIADKKFPHLIGNKNWRLDFSNIEKILWKSKTNTSGELIVDSETLDLLQRASDLLPENIKPIELQRTDLLIAKSLPGEHGKQLAVLLNKFYFYQRDYTASLAVINHAQIDDKVSLLKASEVDNLQRQQQYFGIEVAAKLFGKKNLTTNYLLHRRIVNMNNDLPNKEKEARLAALKENYKKALSN